MKRVSVHAPDSKLELMAQRSFRIYCPVHSTAKSGDTQSNLNIRWIVHNLEHNHSKIYLIVHYFIVYILFLLDKSYESFLAKLQVSKGKNKVNKCS